MPPKAATAAGDGAKTAKSGGERNKVIVRRCPPELPEAIFWKSTEPWTEDDAQVDWKTYRQGRSKRPGQSKESVNSVAYIHFKRPEQLSKFAQAYQGHVFRDKKGHTFTVNVEYAPFQKIPTKRPKPDPLSGTIEEDPDYKSFLDNLNAPTEKPTIPERAVGGNDTKGVHKSTPLLDALRAKKQEKLDKKSRNKKTTKITATVVATDASKKIRGKKGQKGADSTVGDGIFVSAQDIEASASTSDKTKSGGTKSSKAGPENVKQVKGKPVKPSARLKAQEARKVTILAPQRADNAQAIPNVPKTGDSAAPTPTPAPVNMPKSSNKGFDSLVDQFASQMLRDKPKKISQAPTAGSAPQSGPDADVPAVPSTTASGSRGRGRGTAQPSRGRGRGRTLEGTITGTSSTPTHPSDGELASAPPSSRGRGRSKGSHSVSRGRTSSSTNSQPHIQQTT